jgi:plastocyanin
MLQVKVYSQMAGLIILLQILASLTAPAQTFEHTLIEKAGGHLYFCVLHPNMI